MWARQVPALAAAGYRVVTADLLGHGRSDRPSRPGSSYTVADLADSLVRTLEEADVGRAALAGFSLGGGVALQIALARPDRVGALVLADTSAWMGPGASALFTERAAAVEARGVEVLVQPAIARWFTPDFVAAHGDAVARYAARIGENDAYGYAAACRSLATFDVRERLGALRCPTLVVVGDRDQATPVAMAETLANGIPGAELRILGPAGHLLTEERWEAFNEVLLAFLSRADATSPGTT
jgi:3-oxoadipate enol-lactonase